MGRLAEGGAEWLGLAERLLGGGDSVHSWSRAIARVATRFRIDVAHRDYAIN